MEHVEINGRPATAEQLRFPALNNFGHFTAMQVRDRATRGLDHHLGRLGSATRELFGEDLDLDRVRGFLRQAVADTPDAAVRVYVYWPGEPMIMVLVRDPNEVPWTGQRLRTVAYQRPVAHIKHVGGFGQRYHHSQAARDGFDDVLLSTSDGRVTETAIANIGFVRGSEVVWPSGPSLYGTTQALLDERLAERGTPARYEPITRDDVATFDGAFVANSIGLAPVAAIDGRDVPESPVVGELRDLYESVAWEKL